MPLPSPFDRAPRPVARRQLLVFLACVCALLGVFVGPLTQSRDLMALWLAAQEVAAGHPGAIYPPETPVFLMRPAFDWYEMAARIGRPGEVYPYLYPPLWAHLLAPLTRLMTFTTFAQIVFTLNLVALMSLPVIGFRLAFGSAADNRDQLAWICMAVLVLGLMPGTLIALDQGQLQIPVAMLTLFALERAQNGRPVAGGLAMGLAIALKLSPLPLVLLWLIIGQWRAALTAVGLASALGLASIGVAGWPRHLEFLSLLQTVNATVMVNALIVSLDQLVTTITGTEGLTILLEIPVALGPSDAGWAVQATPAGHGALKTSLMLGLIAGFGLALRARPTPGARTALWGAAFTAFAFIGPIGWAYYYIAPLALSPILIHRLGRRGLGLVALTSLLFLFDWLVLLPPVIRPALPIAASIGALVLIAGFVAAAFAPHRENLA
ncbi:MAG: DUF2029 domain-containing protein [Sphingomonadales bacterium]|nr:DUF2029 domain-containing protein [Sphingomonadales bacterium]